MGVRIEEINVEKAGPISGLQLAMGRFNLIYGRNEQGKTFLVEFLIKSLFRNLSGWSLRSSDSRGKVIVSGLSDKPLSLMPSSRRKLEDYLAESESGLPAQISRLLVVKGAELNFEDKNNASVSHAVLKEFLSGQGVLDDIQRRISKTVGAAKIEGGQPIGRNQGEIKTRNGLIDSRFGHDNLFEQIQAIYSGGERQELQTRVVELEEQVEALEGAKCHEAYLLDQQIRELKARIDLLPEEETRQLADDFKVYNDTQLRIDRLERQLEELAVKSEHYEWLDHAIALYEQRGKQGKDDGGLLFPILLVLCLLSAAISSFLNLPLGTLILLIFTVVLGWLYWRQLRAAVDHALDIDEIKKLDAEFGRRFGRPLSGLPLLQKVMKSTMEAYHGAKTQRENLTEEQEKLATLHHQIVARLGRLAGETSDSEEWGAAIQTLFNKQKRLQEKLAERNMALAALGVAKSAYRAEPAAVAFDLQRLQTLREEQTQVTESLKEKTAELDNLKHRICQETKDDISVDWATLIQNLQRRREAVADEYRGLSAQIVAGILVSEALETIRTQEDNKIRGKLTSTQVCAPIQRITRRYSGVRYEDGRLSVIDDYGEFPISDLSTGAREQVLLGLRLGFAAQILGQDRHFLLLDDAFQHADWQRRVWLMDQMVGLARDGWQIIYFSMDDHIKRLFDTAGERLFAGQYKFYDLTTTNN